MRVACLVLVAACASPDPVIELVSPPAAATITTPQVVFAFDAWNLHGAYGRRVTLDQVELPGSEFSGGPPLDCDRCLFEITWTAVGVVNGSHVIAFDFEHDLAGLAGDRTVTLIFAR